MDLRADQKIMIAVGGLGLFALGWMLFGPKAHADETPDPTPMPPSPSFELLQNPARLEQGARYRGVVKLSPLESILPVDKVSNIADKFQGLGFSDVSVYSEAPVTWERAPLANVSNDATTYYAEGVWTQASRAISLPAQITKAWKVV